MQFHRYVVSSMSVCKEGEPGWWKKNWAENDAREIDRRFVTRAKNNWLLTHQLTSGSDWRQSVVSKTHRNWWPMVIDSLHRNWYTISWEKEMNELLGVGEFQKSFEWFNCELFNFFFFLLLIIFNFLTRILFDY